MRTTGAALLNLSRNIGGSVGISVVSTQLVRMTQVAHADMAAADHAADDPDRRPDDAADGRSRSPARPRSPTSTRMITKQALFIAYLDDFKLMMIVTFAVLPLLLFMKRGNKVGGGGPPVHMD